MVVRILVYIGLFVLGAGFVFFAGNVLWLGTKSFFGLDNSKSKKTSKKESAQ